MSEYRLLADVAESLDVTDRWLRSRVIELGVPHLVLSRRRMAFTDEQVVALEKALERSTTQPTSRSRARRGRAA